MGTGTLYIVATPIGNMEDITLRALKVLKDVGLIAAEDTRHTRKLTARYAISTPLTSYFEHNERAKASTLVRKLKKGVDVALVSDAGTPGISDPGYRLIKLAIENSIPVVSIPGASALTSVLSVSGLPLDRFTFMGFVPTTRGRKKGFFLELKGVESTFVMYDAARRIKDTLKCLEEVLGDCHVVLAREMTKLHEEVIRGSVGAVAAELSERRLKGEVTLVVRTPERARREGGEAAEGELAAELEGLLKAGLRLKDVVKALSREFVLPRSEVYKEALKIKAALKL